MLIQKNNKLYSTDTKYIKDRYINPIESNIFDINTLSKYGFEDTSSIYRSNNIDNITINPIDEFKKFKLLVYKENIE